MAEAISSRNITEADYCLAVNAASQSIPSAIDTLVVAPTFTTNNGAMSVTTSRITIDVAGTYIVTAVVRWNGGTDFFSMLNVYLN